MNRRLLAGTALLAGVLNETACTDNPIRDNNDPAHLGAHTEVVARKVAKSVSGSREGEPRQPLNLIIVGDVSGSFTASERPAVVEKIGKLLDVLDPERDSLQTYVMGTQRVPEMPRGRFGREEAQLVGSGLNPVGEDMLARARMGLCGNYASQRGLHSDSLWIFRQINEDLAQAGVDGRRNELVFFWDGEPDTRDDVDWERHPALKSLPNSGRIARYQAMIEVELGKLQNAGVAINVVTPEGVTLPKYIERVTSVVITPPDGDIGFDEFVKILGEFNHPSSATCASATVPATVPVPVQTHIGAEVRAPAPPLVQSPRPHGADFKMVLREGQRQEISRILISSLIALLGALGLVLKIGMRKSDKIIDRIGEILQQDLADDLRRAHEQGYAAALASFEDSKIARLEAAVGRLVEHLKWVGGYLEQRDVTDKVLLALAERLIQSQEALEALKQRENIGDISGTMLELADLEKYLSDLEQLIVANPNITDVSFIAGIRSEVARIADMVREVSAVRAEAEQEVVAARVEVDRLLELVAEHERTLAAVRSEAAALADVVAAESPPDDGDDAVEREPVQFGAQFELAEETVPVPAPAPASASASVSVFAPAPAHTPAPPTAPASAPQPTSTAPAPASIPALRLPRIPRDLKPELPGICRAAIADLVKVVRVLENGGEIADTAALDVAARLDVLPTADQREILQTYGLFMRLLRACPSNYVFMPEDYLEFLGLMSRVYERELDPGEPFKNLVGPPLLNTAIRDATTGDTARAEQLRKTFLPLGPDSPHNPFFFAHNDRQMISITPSHCVRFAITDRSEDPASLLVVEWDFPEGHTLKDMRSGPFTERDKRAAGNIQTFRIPAGQERRFFSASRDDFEPEFDSARFDSTQQHLPNIFAPIKAVLNAAMAT